MLLFSLPGLLLAFSFHEFAHAYVAYKLGDPTAKNLGRLTLDPIAHIDPLGFIMLLIVHFGWAKPVPVNTRNFKNPRRDDMLVSLAGPGANFLLALILAGIIKIFYVLNVQNDYTIQIIATVIFLGVIYNIGLGVFNLLPIPPLDGSHVLLNLLPSKYAYSFIQHQGTIQIIMLVLLFTGMISYIISPISRIMLLGLTYLYQINFLIF